MIGLTLSRKRLHAQLCANLKIRYIGIGYRYRPIRKKKYRYIIGIGRYENSIYRRLSVSADMKKCLSIIHYSSSNMILRNGILNNFFKELLIVLIRIKNLNYDVLQGLG